MHVSTRLGAFFDNLFIHMFFNILLIICLYVCHCCDPSPELSIEGSQQCLPPPPIPHSLLLLFLFLNLFTFVHNDNNSNK